MIKQPYFKLQQKDSNNQLEIKNNKFKITVILTPNNNKKKDNHLKIQTIKKSHKLRELVKKVTKT